MTTLLILLVILAVMVFIAIKWFTKKTTHTPTGTGTTIGDDGSSSLT